MIRNWSDIEALDPPLTAPERQLIEACKAGVECVLGDGTRPEGADPARTIRADLLRYLILGGCDECRVHEWGVQLMGAWISGALDLSFATAKGPTGLIKCRFEKPLQALQTTFEFLNLTGSALPGLFAQGAQVAGAVMLHGGFEAEGEVTLAAAVIGGQLSCVGGTFRKPKGYALNAHNARVTGGVLLSGGFRAVGAVNLSGAVIGGQLECIGGTFRNPNGEALNAGGLQVTGAVFFSHGFKAEGEISLTGAEIGGQLECNGGTFRNPQGFSLIAQGARVAGSVSLRDGFEAEGEVFLSGAAIGGQLSCVGGRFRNPKGRALNGQGMMVTESFFWQEVTVVAGSVSLSSARVGDLVDDLDSWPVGEDRLVIDGFAYARITGAFTDAKSRLDWLARGTVWKGEFHPQPYSQLAKVLREMGHERAARDVLEERARLIAVHARKRIAKQGGDRSWIEATNALRVVADFFLRRVVGYGYKPFRSLGWLLGLWLVAAYLAANAWYGGSMVPNSAVILNSTEWRAVEDETLAAQLWSDLGQPGQDWETFSAIAWGFDVVVPIIDVGQTSAWAPSPARGVSGHLAWWGRWVLSVLGWVVAALAAAAFTGIIRREGE